MLNVVPPEGTLYPEHTDNQARHLMLFAAGSGITPCTALRGTPFVPGPTTT